MYRKWQLIGNKDPDKTCGEISYQWERLRKILDPIKQLPIKTPIILFGDHKIYHLSENDTMSKLDIRQLKEVLNEFTDHAQLAQVKFKPTL